MPSFESLILNSAPGIFLFYLLSSSLIFPQDFLVFVKF